MKHLTFITAIILSLASFAQPAPLKFEGIFFPDLPISPNKNSFQQYPVKKISLPNRLTLEYVEQGDSTGTPVILLHGLSDSWHSYELILEHLPTSIHAIALSLRGHGESDKPDAGYSMEDFADDVAIFLKQKDIQQAVIVGHSMGSMVAQAFVTKYPELTSGLVLVGSFAKMSNDPGMIEFQKIVETLQDPVDIEFITEFQKSTIVREVPDWFFKLAVTESTKLRAHVWTGVVHGLMQSDYVHQFKNIVKPTLIIWGEKDSFTFLKGQYLLRDAIKNSKLMIYNGTGHAVHWEEPKRFASDLSQFVMEIGNKK